MSSCYYLVIFYLYLNRFAIRSTPTLKRPRGVHILEGGASRENSSPASQQLRQWLFPLFPSSQHHLLMIPLGHSWRYARRRRFSRPSRSGRFRSCQVIDFWIKSRTGRAWSTRELLVRLRSKGGWDC
ncbi:hypothetical protein CDEST_08036 [Colletotrichum destructivum]|uniref:Uncharacterized protein n=1 Tax=Colletotrichum destructivum TaxID=34406 RepID=A0AAX4IHW2_9PEZI|nr:hypothetical protein CDEST_08036 [Colletotrichum destructivum]